MSDLTTDVLTLADETSNYFGGDYEGYTQIEGTLTRIETAFKASGIKDGKYLGKLVLLTPAHLDVLDAVIQGFSPHPCTADHYGSYTDEGDIDHGDERECFGYGPAALQALDEASELLNKAARS